MSQRTFHPILEYALGVAATTFLLAASVVIGQDMKHGIGSWPESGRGNHRALVRVTKKCDAVWAHIPWRRRDRHPEKKDIRIFDAATGKRVLNVVRVNVNREYGDLVFQPATVPGTYEIYYLPYNPPPSGPFGSGGDYFELKTTADAAWVAKHGLNAEGLKGGKWQSLPYAEFVEIQARGEFHRMDPMEVIATEQETAQLLAEHPSRTYLLFPEDRKHPIRMFEDLPYRWIKRGPSTTFKGEAQPGEFYVFQIGVWACRKRIDDLNLNFTDLNAEKAKPIPASAIRCFNLGGSDWLGRRMRKTFAVGRGIVRPLWIGVQIPRDAKGMYTGAIKVRPRGAEESIVNVELRVAGAVLEDAGDSELWRLSRLRWLDSTLGLDDEVIPPYTPLEVESNTVRCLGREVTFGKLGLPENIRSNNRDVLARPVDLIVESPSGRARWSAGGTRVLKAKPGVVVRETVSRGRTFDLTVRAKMEFDGCLTYRATLKANEATNVSDIRLEVPLPRSVARYMMGMGRQGGYRPKVWRWKWNLDQVDNMVWLGDFDAGLQLKLCGDTDTWQLRNHRQSGLPASWDNDGRGGCDITEERDRVLVRAFTGPRRLDAGQEFVFRFRFLITPFKPIDPEHWNWRVGNVKGDANILHLHHATRANPYINYPFLTVNRLIALVKSVKSIRYKETDLGRLTYPARGNINTSKGALHVWVRINFDPKAGQPRQAQFNQSLFSLDFPNEDQLGFYWNIDDRGMRAYVRIGSPTQNRYPILFGTHLPDWRKGQRHLLTLSWGNRLAVFIDGKQRGVRRYRGILPNSLEGAELNFRGSGFIIDAIKITDAPFRDGVPVTPTVDAHTLLLDTFASWDGGARTRPEKIATGGCGAIMGVCKSARGLYGKEIVFSSRKVKIPPKGVNIYYTVRELSNHVAEMWALRSLGDEVFKTGGINIYLDGSAVEKTNKGYPWLREHLVTGYETAWRQRLSDTEMDAAIQMQGLSRWHNYYIEGLAWLMRNTGVDGLYLDGIGYDREIMKRVAKAMYQANPRYRINFHSGNGWSPPWDRDRKMSAANVYMEHFPYISNLWFGELFDYNMPPDYWLVEISGIPFGLTGEMLNYQTGGNPYRGMIYGMTSRQHPSHVSMWRFWDEFGIQDAEMFGYWNPACPVQTDHDGVLATVYRKPGKSLIALARWPVEPTRRKAFTRPVAIPPVIDGQLAAGEWDAAAKLTGFTVFAGDDLAKEQTEVFITHDARNLYLSFRCVHSRGPIKAEATHRDGKVWEDDAIEFFLQPDVTTDTYYQFVGNCKGVFADNRNQKMKWNGDWIYVASVGEGYWQGELRIPYASLGMTAPEEGKTMGFNVCRDQQLPSKQLSCWSPMYRSFHDVNAFGRLVFSSVKPATREQLDRLQQTAYVHLRIDWRAVGIDPATAKLTAPSIAHFQPAAQFSPDDEIPVKPGRGWLLILDE